MTQRPASPFIEFLKILRPFWSLMSFAALMGTLSGFATAALLATTNDALHAEHGAARGLLLGFAGLCVLVLIGEIISDTGINISGQRVVAALRKDLCARVLSAPLAQLEQLKAHKLLATLNQDVDAISTFAFIVSSLSIATAVLLGCIGYMFFLSPLMCAVTLIAIVVGVAVFNLARRKGVAFFGVAREAGDDLQRHYRALTEGAKELRISRPRRERLFGHHLTSTIDRIRDFRIRGANIFVSANAFGSLLYFLVIGLLLLMHSFQPTQDASVVSGFVLVLLYMRGPIQEIVGALPIIGRAQVAFRKVSVLSSELAWRDPALAAAQARTAPDQAIETIELRGAGYRFPVADGQAPFTLGPVNLTIHRGEILFIVGENGCGKTTLIKLLMGLYSPSEGQVVLDGRPVDDTGMDAYRQLFSAVFFDYYLFDDLVLPDGVLPEEAGRYLRRLDLEHKVTIRDGAFSTTDLSAGQRKRLALVQVYLEGRPVLVFDEWAAEQDPTFRRIFYTELLPELKRQGKTLVVISHDDRYFHVADRCLRLQAGRVVSETRNDRPATARPAVEPVS
ncbi:cyclic peptide export ABC transporter [Reyranella sp. CPCC 100927]|uniref:cyclic peptide export ABC transporter n=1 Tax=Reyranella sp. CPCC 100927 TaxID=2599616 RepID=UPI0011B84951|nr:cyclic peptide export ABC transporter [Reyranella sp. CPCC 100927]TWT12527.1 cyclic peptide export ABC transporter [Reyranella sp. CPCC 100927]